MARTDPSARRPNQDRRGYDDFRESLSAPVPNRTYRSRVDASDDRVSVLEQIVRYLAVLLGVLLAVRFVVSLFTANVANGLVGFLRDTTNWIVSPFQTLLGRPPAGTGGFFDWPTLAALIVVAVMATLLVGLLRPREY